MRTGLIYTETTVYLAPECFQPDVPYQVVIVSLDDGGRVTARIEGDAVTIEDRVTEVQTSDGVPRFRKSV